MRQAAPELNNPGTFDPDDVKAMEAAFEAACERAGISHAHASDRRAMALAIIFAFNNGEREQERLVIAAIKAASAAA